MELLLLAVVTMEVVQAVTAVSLARNGTRMKKCEDDDDCEEERGEMCCFDLSSPSEWPDDQSSWRKKCCTNLSGSPVIRPPDKLTQQQMEKVTKLFRPSR